ncbi:MAG: hypothetical protein WC796_04175 [Candidatus Pacearchaeota archaeon]
MESNKDKLPICCSPNVNSDKSKGIKQGIFYGLIPHAGCIAFIVLSVLGMTFAASIFKPLLMKSYFFYAMIGLSLVFATLSAGFYLRKNKSLSFKGIKGHKSYLLIMYGITIGVALVLYFFIFPMVVGATINMSGSAVKDLDSYQSVTLQVAIPCSGHGPLIVEEVKKVDGVIDVKFKDPNIFQVFYDSSKTDKQKIESISIFNEYKAKEVN